MSSIIIQKYKKSSTTIITQPHWQVPAITTGSVIDTTPYTRWILTIHHYIWYRRINNVPYLVAGGGLVDNGGYGRGWVTTSLTTTPPPTA